MAVKKRKRKAKRAAAKKRRGARSRKADRARVSGKQRHEVAYLARKHKVSAAVVRKAIRKVGNFRKKIEAELQRM